MDIFMDMDIFIWIMDIDIYIYLYPLSIYIYIYPYIYKVDIYISIYRDIYIYPLSNRNVTSKHQRDFLAVIRFMGYVVLSKKKKNVRGKCKTTTLIYSICTKCCVCVCWVWGGSEYFAFISMK